MVEKLKKKNQGPNEQKYSNQDLRNENNVEKSDQLHCPTRKRKVQGIFLLLNFPSTI